VLVLIVLAILNLPGSDCESDYSAGSAGVLLVALMAAGSLGCVGAAAVRIVSISRAGRDLVRNWTFVGGSVVVVLAVTAALTGDGGGEDFVAWLMVVGTGITALLLAVLVVAWLARRRLGDVGMLLPVYLLGAGLAVYPLFTWIALALTSGGLC
jgi:hypothetical protein